MTVIRVAAPGTSVAPAPVDSADLRAASDAELLESVRYGDDVAFAVLWHRHLPAAYAAATRFRGRVAAEDLVAEASARVLRLVRQGQGPTHNFRAYFVQTVRSVGVDAVRGSITVVPTPSEDLDLLPGLLPGPEASTVGDVEVDTELVREAFHGLPDSDQELLWRTMVEGEAPRTVAPLLGVSANVVSARAKRARDALRTSYLDAWVQRRAPHCGSPECRWVLDHLSGYVRGRLTPRQQARAGTHLASCPTDARLEADLRRVHDGFRGFVGPLVLIAGAASPALGHGTMAQLVGAHAASAGLGVSSAAGTVTATGATASTATATTTAATTAATTATTSTAVTTAATSTAVTTAATATTTAATASTVTTTAAAASVTTVATASTVTTAATASTVATAAATSVTTAAASTVTTAAAASTVTTAAVATSTVTTAAAASTAAVGAAAAAVPVAAAALPAAAAVGGTVLLSGTALGPPIASAVAGLVMSLGVSAAPAGASQQQVAQPVSQTVDAPVSLASAPGEGATTGSSGSLAQSLVLPQPGAGATAQVVATTGGALTTVRLGFTTSTGSDPSSIDTSASTTGTTGPAASSTPPSTSGSTGTDPALSAPVPTESSTTAPADTSTTTATTTGTTSPTSPAPDPTSPATAPTTSDPSATGSPTPDPTETAPATSDPSSTVSPTPDPSETATPDPSVSATSEPAATVPVSPQTGG